VFEGNTGDPTTVSDQITKLKKRFGLKRVVMVGLCAVRSYVDWRVTAPCFPGHCF
jgi:hypothetical protein